MRNPFPISRETTPNEKVMDLLSWRYVGTGLNWTTCNAVNKYGIPCRAPAAYLYEDRRYCQHHWPPGAERR